MATVTANGIRIEYESFGNNDAPVIVLVMGLGMQLIAWPDPFCQKLAAAGFRVIRFDNRDIGLSTYFDERGVPNMVWQFIKARIGVRVRAPYDLNDMAADTVGLLDALQIEKAHIVGASMGGMIAQQVAAKYPERVRSLVSIMSTSGDRSLPPATRDAQRALFRAARGSEGPELARRPLCEGLRRDREPRVPERPCGGARPDAQKRRALVPPARRRAAARLRSLLPGIVRETWRRSIPRRW
jgi:pimeloyl-ACP methyl ester carboxylesterase